MSSVEDNVIELPIKVKKKNVKKASKKNENFSSTICGDGNKENLLDKIKKTSRRSLPVEMPRKVLRAKRLLKRNSKEHKEQSWIMENIAEGNKSTDVKPTTTNDETDCLAGTTLTETVVPSTQKYETVSDGNDECEKPKKRNTYELKPDESILHKTQTKKRRTYELDINDSVCLKDVAEAGNEKKKRNTYELDPDSSVCLKNLNTTQKADVSSTTKKRRSTFELDPDDAVCLKNITGIVDNDTNSNLVFPEQNDTKSFNVLSNDIIDVNDRRDTFNTVPNDSLYVTKIRRRGAKDSILQSADLNSTTPQWIKNSVDDLNKTDDDKLNGTSDLSSNMSKHVTLAGRTSTPKTMAKPHNSNILQKSILKKTVKFVDSTTKKPAELVKSVGKVKFPNYSKIHENAFNKMESIADYMERKAERARILLSGGKPKSDILKKGKTDEQKDLKSKKQLAFNVPGDSPKLIKKNVDSPKLCKKNVDSPKLNQRIIDSPKLNQRIVDSPKLSKKIVDSPKILATKTKQELMTTRKSLTKIHLLTKEQSKLPKKVTVATTKNTQMIPLKIHVLKSIKSSEYLSSTDDIVRKQNNKVEDETKKKLLNKEGYSRFGFKLNSTLTKQDEINNVANKSRTLKNGIDDRRCMIRGVRSNRRFDLLMKMRQKNAS